MYEDIEEPEIVVTQSYKGKIETITENKIFFIIDKELKKPKFGASNYNFEDVRDYQITYDTSHTGWKIYIKYLLTIFLN